MLDVGCEIKLYKAGDELKKYEMKSKKNRDIHIHLLDTYQWKQLLAELQWTNEATR